VYTTLTKKITTLNLEKNYRKDLSFVAVNKSRFKIDLPPSMSINYYRLMFLEE
jgi:hypothetical protein